MDVNQPKVIAAARHAPISNEMRKGRRSFSKGSRSSRLKGSGMPVNLPSTARRGPSERSAAPTRSTVTNWMRGLRRERQMRDPVRIRTGMPM